MRRNNQTQYPLPSHRFLFFNKLRDWIAYISIAFLVFVILCAMVIRYSVKRDCENYYRRDLRIFGYWININVGSADEGCPIYETE